MGKIENFEDLTVWRVAMDFAVDIYTATKQFPKEESFGVTSQIRRAATSISANIAEGFGRSTIADKTHFYTMAYGSLLETRNFLHLSLRLGYLDAEEFNKLIDQSLSCKRLIVASKKAINS